MKNIISKISEFLNRPDPVWEPIEYKYIRSGWEWDGAPDIEFFYIWAVKERELNSGKERWVREKLLSFEHDLRRKRLKIQ